MSRERALTSRHLQVGNKADLADRREVDQALAMEFAAINNIPYIETSVIGRSNINVSFQNHQLSRS